MFQGNVSLLRLSLGVFIVAFQSYLITYVNSALITERIGSAGVTPLYMGEALLGILLFFFAARILRHIGAKRFLSIFLCIVIAALTTIATVSNPVVTAGAFIIAMACSYMIYFSLDIFVEHATLCEGITGKVRGVLLTLGNSALIIAPLLMAVLLRHTSYGILYLISAGLLCVFAALALPLFRSFTDPVYTPATIASLKEVLARHPDLIFTIGAQLMLSIFYAFAAIYMPLYLLNLGFSWSAISIILVIALLPYVVVEFPLGRIADKYTGERGIMLLGFLILIAATTVLALPLHTSLTLYALLFLATRFGAAMIEITTETHFFRSVQAKDGIVITLGRTMVALGYVIGAGIGGMVLSHTTIHHAFLYFGLALLPGLYFAFHIKDIRHTSA